MMTKKLLFTGLMSLGFGLIGADQEPFQKEKERLMNYVEYVHSKGWRSRDDIYTLFSSLLQVMFFLKRPKVSCSYINSLSNDDFAALKFDVLLYPRFDTPVAQERDNIVEGELKFFVKRMEECRALQIAN